MATKVKTPIPRRYMGGLFQESFNFGDLVASPVQADEPPTGLVPIEAPQVAVLSEPKPQETVAEPKRVPIRTHHTTTARVRVVEIPMLVSPCRGCGVGDCAVRHRCPKLAAFLKQCDEETPSFGIVSLEDASVETEYSGCIA